MNEQTRLAMAADGLVGTLALADSFEEQGWQATAEGLRKGLLVAREIDGRLALVPVDADDPAVVA